jgi:hypothetical protein
MSLRIFNLLSFYFQIAKMLIQFAVCEPGMNWFNQRYVTDRSGVPVPGWELPLLWYEKEYLTEKGVLNLRYYAGEGIGMKGCRPRRRLRYALLTNSIITVDDLKDEEKELYADHGSTYYSVIPSTMTPESELALMLVSYCNSNITWSYHSISDCHP